MKYIISLIGIVAAAFFVISNSSTAQPKSVTEISEPEFKEVDIEVVDGSTFGTLMKDYGVTSTLAHSLFTSSEDVYDLSKVRIGKNITLFFDEQEDLQKLIYPIDTEEELHINKSASSTWGAARIPIEYETRIVQKNGTVDSSMYQAAIDGDIDIRAIIDLAEVFQWSVDFALDPRVGDTFEFIYEERYRDGEYVMPANVLAGVYNNAGKVYQTYYFDGGEEPGYFDEDGNSAVRMFLKAPVHYKYISSGFTTGRRYVAAFDVSTGHRAIDYAAPAGTPIRATGDGTVTSAGWSSAGYGYLTKIRHNGTFSTNYAHQSKIAVRRGQKVKQGDVIGYVGSTGFSTGPHLHYEMVKHGIKINPLREEFPSGEPIATELLADYKNSIADYQKKLIEK